MRRAVWQWLLVGFALVWGAGGCTCGEPPVESKLEVAFEKPEDGQRLSLADDADPAAEGFQYEVVAVARDTADRPVALASAKLEVRAPSEQQWREGGTAVIDGATVRFPGTLLQPRTNVLQVTVEEAGSRRTATQRISVVVSSDPPSVDLAQPAEGQVMREADDADPATAGYQLRFSVKSVGLAGKTGTLYCENACGVPPTDFTLGNSGLTQVSVTLAQASACEAQEAACYAVVNNGDKQVTSGKRHIVLDTVAPRVELVSPVAPVASTTFKVEATVGCAESGLTATLSREGERDLSVPVSAGGITFPAVTVPVDGNYTFTLRVADEGGNVTTRQIPVTVASTAPTLSLVVPENPVTTDADSNLAGVQVPVRVQANSLPVGTEVRLFTNASSPRVRPQRAVTAVVGMASEAAFTAHLAEGANTVRACVSNAAGIEQCTTESITVSMGLSGCRIGFQQGEPALEEGILLSASPSNVRVFSANGPVTLKVLGTEIELSEPAAAGSALFSLPSLPEGEHRLEATCPGGGTSLLSFGVDSTEPALSFNVHGVPAGQTVLGPELNDTSNAPGMQIALDVNTEPYATVSAKGCGTSIGVSGKADARGVLLLRGVSVPPSGTCSLEVTSEDLAGNITPQTRDLTLAFIGSELQFVSPAGGRYLSDKDGSKRPGGGLLVEVALSVTTTTGGTLRLLRGTTQIASVPVSASGGPQEKRFTDVALEEGANVLRAELIGPNGTVACATVLLLVDTQPGTIALVIPTSSPGPFRVSSDVLPDVPGLQAPLQYTPSTLPPSAVVDICTSQPLVPGATPCRDGSGWFTLATGVGDFTPAFTYPEGRYGLKAVLEDGTVTSSREIALTVDNVEPMVRAVELLGDANGDRRLNAAELPSGVPQVRITVDGLEDGSPVQVRNWPSRNIIYGHATASGGQATVSLNAIPPGVRADYSLVVTVTDAAGNPNRLEDPKKYHPVNEDARFAFLLDRVAPSLVPSAPSRLALGLADDGNPNVDDFQLQVTVNTDEDVETEGSVRMELTPVGGTVNLTPSDEFVATHVFTLPATGKTTYTLRVSAVDSSGNFSEPLVREILVDLEAPTVELVTPAANTTYSTTELPVQVNVGGGDVGLVRVFTKKEGNTDPAELIGELPVVGGVAQGVLNFPLGVQTVSVQAHDVAGNLASDAVSSVDVRQPGCPIQFTTPSAAVVTLLAKDDLDTTTPGLQYRLRGTTPACRGRTVTLYRGNPPTPPGVTTTADATTGDFFFDVTLADGEQARFTAEVINVSSLRTIDVVDVTVDITPPRITSVSPNPTTLYFVAETNVFLFPTPAADRVVDLAPGGDANATFTLTVAQGVGSTVQAFYRGNPASAEFTVTADPQTLEVPVTLTHDSAGALELRVRDASGNVALHTVAATVDVVPPAAPTVTRELVQGQERAAKVAVTWTASGDDGLSGMPAGYDLRWTLNAQLPNGISDQAVFFGPKVKQETGNLLPAGTTSYTLTLPPLARYSIQLRPRDEIGNYPPFQATPPLDNFWRQLTLTNPNAAGNNYGLYIASRGDLNADGRADLVVAAASSVPGTAYVYYGSSDPVAQPPSRQDLSLPETGSQFYGSDFDIGDVGNAGADAVQDLLVGVRGYAGTSGANSGRAFLYFGRKGSTVDTAGSIEFRNVPGVAGASLGGTVKIIGDITGDGLRELMLSSHAESPPKVYLFYGRSPDAWRALGTGCTASTACVVPTSSADKVITAPAGTLFFGRSRGYARLGDITGDGIPDFTVPASHETLNNLYVFSGGAVRGLPGSAVSVANAIQVLHQDPNGTGTAITGFGAEAVGGVDLAGEAGLDLVVSMATQSKVFVYRDGGAAGFSTPPLEIRGGSRFGNSVARGDLNGDGRQDLAIGQNITTGGAAFVFYNRGIPGAEFDTLQEGGFSQSKLESPSALGISLTILDFNGDGKPDLAAGDSQSNPARVVVYY